MKYKTNNLRLHLPLLHIHFLYIFRWNCYKYFNFVYIYIHSKFPMFIFEPSNNFLYVLLLYLVLLFRVANQKHILPFLQHLLVLTLYPLFLLVVHYLLFYKNLYKLIQDIHLLSLYYFLLSHLWYIKINTIELFFLLI